MRFPSKTFLLGEYLVLHGGGALLLTHAPFFSASSTPKELHPDSPAGKLATKHQASISFSLVDPYQGSGGFGASGAEFLGMFVKIHGEPKEEERERFAWDAWNIFRSLTSESGSGKSSGSGADILAQGFSFNREDLVALSFQPAKLKSLPRTLGLKLVLFHTGKKFPTHHTVKPELPWSTLSACVAKAEEAVLNKNANAFCQAIQEYGKILDHAKLLAPHSAKALQSLPPVRAAKGCGAMGADVLLVIPEEGSDLSAWAKENSLAQIGSFYI